jgi:2-polyprenyl-6-methoxyphenol hydroxylase-like FAD-dependent oxidoreductase
VNAKVLVVGAGPTGLTLAIELARRGIETQIIDASAELHGDTRALGVQPRTLELFEKIGIAAAAVDRGLPVAAFSVFSENKQIVHVDMSNIDTPFPFTLMLPQHQTESLLAARLADFGVEVQRSVELRSLTQHPDSVEATLRHADGAVESIEAAWLVGCDGARSTVRSQLGVPFAGTAFEENFAVADLRMDWSLPHDQFYAFLNRGNFVAYFPMPSGAYRTAVGYPKRRAPQGEVTFAELERAVEKCSPPGARVTDVEQTARFRINQRKVKHHSVGRVFLAGDAAHVHSVVGAQGMNTGIQDAFNLGWKLAAVAQNRGHSELLGTYHTERAPVVNKLVKATRAFTRLVLLGSPVATAVRRGIASRVMSRTGPQASLAKALSETDISYRRRSLLRNRGRLAVGDRAPNARAATSSTGARVTLFDVFDEERHTLMVVGAGQQQAVSTASDYPDQVRVLRIARSGETPAAGSDSELIDSDGQVGTRYQMPGGGYVLIRPDGYVAALGRNGKSGELGPYLRQTFVRRPA